MILRTQRAVIAATSAAAIVGVGACESTGNRSSTATTVDPCALVTSAEVVEFLGVAAVGRRDGLRCEWRGENTAEMLTLTLGRTGSTMRDLTLGIPGDTLNPRSAGDGMYFVQFHAIAFAGRHRTGTIQIERTAHTNPQREAAEVRLARLVRPRLVD
ncbi:hypothetical protein HH308_02460 [Gordonia sp. TBRC 11910]|uniref:DUF3558 domain-containing protein n=1 Tax=Gordonia asplenii TaxID=2725283 RepID=A0A848KUA4_9ACTN|nr:hypothetical protein [Gordonia asplenii]NMO00073.1 hypothetical protein [Gordonia asplenii]